MRKAVMLFSCLLLSSSLTACSHGYYPFLYHPPLAQGNVINPAAFDELKPGMSKAEVINLVGEPVLSTPFTPDTWRYVYTLREHNQLVSNKQVTLYFNGDTLTQIDDK